MKIFFLNTGFFMGEGGEGGGKEEEEEEEEGLQSH